MEALIREAGVLSVMPSYNEVDGVPSHANRWLLEDVLRGEMGFRGYTYSDWSGVAFNCEFHHVAADHAEAGAMALEAGVDLEAPEPTCYRHLAGLVKSGRIKEVEIDKAAGRVLPSEVPRRIVRRTAGRRSGGACRRLPTVPNTGCLRNKSRKSRSSF